MDSVSPAATQDKCASAVMDLARQLVGAVESAGQAGDPIHQLELGLWKRLLAMGRAAMDYFLSLVGDGDEGERLSTAEGTLLKRSEHPHARRYVSIFGEFLIPRWVYVRREGQRIESAPLDARLQLPERDFSYPLQNWSQMLSVQMPYRQVGEVLDRLLGLQLSVSTLERLNTAMADAVAAYWEKTATAPSDQGDLVVISADGKGIPIHKRANASATIEAHDHQRGPKPDRKRMAVLGAVYEATARPRSVEAVWQSLFQDPTLEAANDEPSAKGDGPIDKRLRGCLAQVDEQGKERNPRGPLFAWLGEQVRQRDPRQEKPLLVLMDGQHCLWEDARGVIEPQRQRVEILDLLHATSKLWELVHLFHPSGTQAAYRAMRFCTRVLLLGHIEELTVWFRDEAKALESSARQRLESICGYFDHHGHRMRYADYLAAGYPIASGVIEGACRHVVRDRMERSGMRWCLEGAAAMLDLRCVYLNGQWEDFMAQRIASENARLYPNAPAGGTVQWPVAA